MLSSAVLKHSLFQDKFTGGAYPLLHTSQELLRFPFSAAGYHISILLWAGLAELKSSSILTSLSQRGIKQNTSAFHPHRHIHQVPQGRPSLSRLLSSLSQLRAALLSVSEAER